MFDMKDVYEKASKIDWNKMKQLPQGKVELCGAREFDNQFINKFPKKIGGDLSDIIEKNQKILENIERNTDETNTALAQQNEILKEQNKLLEIKLDDIRRTLDDIFNFSCWDAEEQEKYLAEANEVAKKLEMILLDNKRINYKSIISETSKEGFVLAFQVLLHKLGFI